MCDMNITQVPAAWAEFGPDMSEEATNGITNGTNTANGHTNGHSGHREDDASEIRESFLEGKFVRTVYGLVPLKHALDWPLFASYDELSGCASWMGGRIPTFEEARSIYAYVDVLKEEEAERKLGRTVPAVNGLVVLSWQGATTSGRQPFTNVIHSHLSNDGVEESPPQPRSNGVGGASSERDELFLDLDGANVGFQHWHPMPITANGDRLAGQAEMGGGWEWTSSALQKWDGFTPMSLYPGYTADFFDGKHNIVLGGSWATHPRIAGRKSL